jgi:hypothetical protein
VGLVADLQALAGVFADHERDPDVRAKPKTGPRLSTGFQPSHLGKPVKPTFKWRGEEKGWEDLDGPFHVLERAGWFDRIWAAVPRPEGPKAPEGLGSSIARNSHRPPRYGFNGFPKAGRDNVSDALELLEERRPLLSFWTVTLPTAALIAFAVLGTWGKFVARLLQKLKRALLKRLGLALFVGVVEVQPQRSAASGIPCLHLHVVFQGRVHSKGSWAISRKALDAMIESAAREAGLSEDVSFESAGNVQQVKKSVRAYLSEYMTKGCDRVEQWIGGEWEALIPRQWWSWSDQMRDLVRSCTIQLPTGFMAWVWKHRASLLERGALYLQQCEVPDDAPATYRAFWGNAAKLALLLAEWQEWVDDRITTARREAGIYTQMGQLVYAKPLGFRRFEPLVFERIEA